MMHAFTCDFSSISSAVCDVCVVLSNYEETNKRGSSYQGSSSRIPLLLSCGHTFCTDCLNKVAKVQKSSIQCMIRTCQVGCDFVSNQWLSQFKLQVMLTTQPSMYAAAYSSWLSG